MDRLEEQVAEHIIEIPRRTERMTEKDIRDYIRIDLGQAIRHDPEMLLEALEETASMFCLDEWKRLKKPPLANEPMMHTHSYGFHTAYGRAIRDHFSSIYYN